MKIYRVEVRQEELVSQIEFVKGAIAAQEEDFEQKKDSYQPFEDYVDQIESDLSLSNSLFYDLAGLEGESESIQSSDFDVLSQVLKPSFD